MAEPLVLYSVKSAVATVTLNRPASRNALTPELAAAVLDAMKKADQDPNVRVIIVTGSGKGFCAGANLKAQGSEFDFSKPEKIGRNSHDVLVGIFGNVVRSLVRSSKPVIAAVNGVAAGAGASLALAADFRVMSTDASILQAFVNVALVQDAGSSFFLTRLVGYSRALEITLEGKPVPAARCLELGLANKVVAPQDLLFTAQKWAEALAAKGSFALLGSKRAMQYALINTSLDEIIEHEAIWQSYAAGSPDNMEGVMAFFEKRSPKFVGPSPDAPSTVLRPRL